jgi:VCBS repeat-containing protein
MKNSIVFLLAFLFSTTLLSGCGSIYSPTLNLPHEPLAKNEGQITGSLSALPQNGDHGDLGITYSGEGQISYAFSDRISIQLKAWSQLSELYQIHYNGGTSASLTYLLNSKNDNIPMALIATSSMLINGYTIDADGGSLHLAAWLPEFGIFRPYAALGAGIMAANFKTGNWGYGGIMNAGTSIKLSDNFRANIEVFGILQRYIYYHTITGYLAPSISLSWHFNNN